MERPPPAVGRAAVPRCVAFAKLPRFVERTLEECPRFALCAGPEIAGHPVWNLRCKTPDQEQATVPWHQDAAYLAEEAGTLRCLLFGALTRAWLSQASTVLQPTAWIPLIDATVKNGCMQVRPCFVAAAGCTDRLITCQLPRSRAVGIAAG